jgi:8-hydroxy-5-deazaflavin:NADPH oxidoreductase
VSAQGSWCVAALVKQFGYALVNLGKIAEGGQLVQARDGIWAPLIFEDLRTATP